MISVITITYNNLSGLKKTVSSVIKYSGFSESVINELIVVDNLSIDGTDLFMRKLTNTNISLNYHRESDFGVYDAMNKGIKLASGDLIGILNSDDMFEDVNVISQIVNSIGDYDAIYSDLCYVKQDDTNKIIRYWKSGEFTDSSFENGWMAPHPTLFVKKEIFEKFGMYNIELSNSADYEFILRVFYKYKVKVKY